MRISILLPLLVLSLCATAPAATIQVLVANDTGAGSLRAAIATANGNGVDDTITFAASLAGQTITLTSDDAAGTALFGPTGLLASEATALTIQGGAASGITISGNDARRVLAVGAGATLVLENVTISSGRAAGFAGGNGAGGGGGAAGLGGGIFVNAGGTLRTSGCTFTSNSARGGSGGRGQTLRGGGGGGGIGGVGAVGMTPTGGAGGAPNGGVAGSPGTGGGQGGGGGGGTQVTGNTNTGGGSGGLGGGGGGGGSVFGAGTGNSVGGPGGFGGGGGGRGSIDEVAGSGGGAGGFAGGSGGHNTTLGNRTGGGGGGGLGGALFNLGGTVVLVNTTLSGNSAVRGAGGVGFFVDGSPGQGRGGAILTRNGTLTLVGCTLANNTAAQGGGALVAVGDGATATVTIQNSILADSAGGVQDAQGVTINAGTVTATGSANVIEASAGLAAVGALATDPVLQSLANNGGATQTHALGLNSSALGVGQGVACAAAFPAGSGGVDQRGLSRRASCDAGAFEAQTSMLVTTQGTPQSVFPSQAFPTPLTVRASDAFGNLLQGVAVSFTLPATGASASVVLSPSTTNAAGEIQATATANATGGAYSVTAATGSLSQVFSLTNMLTVTVSAGDNQSQFPGDSFQPLEVTVTGLGGAPQAGVTVTFSAPTTGASATLTGSPVTTDAQGKARVMASANATGGAYTVTASAPGGSASLNLTNKALSGGGPPLGASTPQRVIKLKGKDCSIGSSPAPWPWSLLLALGALGWIRRQSLSA